MPLLLKKEGRREKRPAAVEWELRLDAWSAMSVAIRVEPIYYRLSGSLRGSGLTQARFRHGGGGFNPTPREVHGGSYRRQAACARAVRLGTAGNVSS
jgi:hypothetical protein